MKTLKKLGHLELVKLDNPVSTYGVWNGGRFRGGLTLEEANDLFNKVKKIQGK